MSKIGKKITYIDSNNFIEEAAEDNFNSDSTYYEINDAIRYYSKNFWTMAGSKCVVASENDTGNVLFTVSSVDDNTIELKANQSKFLNRIINENGILEDKFDNKKWQQFIKDITPNKNAIFYDYYFNFMQPLSLADIDASDSSLNYINREFRYGFYSQKYENISSNRTIDITTLPNIFSILNDKKLDTRTYEENLALSLGGLINQNYVDSLYIANEYNDNVKKYFDEYGDKYNTVEARTVINQIAQSAFNAKIDQNKIKLCRTIKYIPFPYYCDIKFTNDANNLNNLIHFMNSNGKITADLLKHLSETQENIEQKKFIVTNDIVEQKTIPQFDLKYWINKEITGELNLGTADGSRIYNENSRIYSQIEYTNLIEYIKNNVKQKTRKYSEILNKPCEYEILLYKIEKRQFNNNTAPVQTFWITPDDGDFIRLIDTQIKYGTEYFYNISAYVLIVGNEYSYEQYVYENELEHVVDISQGKTKLKVNCKASYKIAELQISSISGAIHEFPITKPVVKLIKDKDDVRINLMQSAANTLEEFEIIENKDFNLFESIKRSQENTELDKIESRFINNSQGLQIYKSITKPISYLSFQGKLYKTLTINNEKSFIDSVIPNTKYWYLFRYLNNHNTPSNVSDIYEVEMKNEDGYSYLNVSVLDLKKGAEKTFYKNMKRYLLIRPSVIQTQIKTPEFISSVDDVSLGPPANSVWDKDFKIRLTSKKTNRILEFDLKSVINRKKE